MSDSRVIRKLPIVALVFVLCLGVLLPGAIHSALANDQTLQQGDGGQPAPQNPQQGDGGQPAPQNPQQGNGGQPAPQNPQQGNGGQPGGELTETEKKAKGDAKKEEAEKAALPPSVTGSCGKCDWEFKFNEGSKDTYTFTIKPADKVSGELEPWENSTPPWATEGHQAQVLKTTSVVVDDLVKVGQIKDADGKVTEKGTTAGMFKGFANVTEFDLSGLDTTNAADMSEMFSGCKKLTELDVSDLDTGEAENMSEMFKGCSALEELKLNGTGWDTSKVTNFAGIFSGCKALKELDISTWSTEKVAPGGTLKMFDGVPRLQKLVVSYKVNLKKAGIEKLFGKHITWSPESDTTRVFKTAAALKRFHGNKKNFDGAETYLRTKKRATWKKDADGQVYCMQDGMKLTGWQNLWGTVKNPASKVDNWFFFDEDGFALTGKHKLLGGKKNDKGETEEHWFCFDEETGAQIRGWVEGDGNKKGTWYCYSLEDGAGYADGRFEIEGGKDSAKHWFAFDKEGQQIRGWHPIDNQWYHYALEDGAGLVGQHEVEGGKNGGMNWFYFDETTGAQIRGWKEITSQNKWCYYSDEDGTMLKGQHELPGGDDGGKNWFYFDEVTGAELRSMWKDIPSQGKRCYYGTDGAMYKGTHVIDGKEYHFDPVTGAVL